jgi:RimJ/RimL family protein N-acetyltransferase
LLGPGDRQALAAALEDPDLAGWVAAPSGDRGRDAQALLGELRRMQALGIVEQERLVALIAAWSDGDREVAEVAYWVAASHRRRGLATAMLRAVAGHELGAGPVQRLWLETDPENHASQRVAERAGFRREGTLRLHCRDRRSGRRHDCVIFSLLRDEIAAAGELAP